MLIVGLKHIHTITIRGGSQFLNGPIWQKSIIFRIRVAPDIRSAGYPAGYPAFFDIRYPAGYPVSFAGYLAGYPDGWIAGYPARRTVLNLKNKIKIKKN